MTFGKRGVMEPRKAFKILLWTGWLIPVVGLFLLLGGYSLNVNFASRAMFNFYKFIVWPGMHLLWLYVLWQVIRFYYDTWAIRRLLRAKGFDWVKLKDAAYYHFVASREMRRLPPRDDLLPLPEYKDGDVENLVDIAINFDPAMQSEE